MKMNNRKSSVKEKPCPSYYPGISSSLAIEVEKTLVTNYNKPP